MNTFIDDNFLLRYPFAEILYHDYAKNLPIIDYHSHLSPSAIARNEQFQTITKIWLEGDHYKWRAMRTLGIDEKFITGNASDAEKFQKWAETVPYTVRNPLYHWTHLELTRYFNINQLLGPETATRIYLQSNEMLQTDHFRTQALLKKMKAEVICTTDDPTDDLAYHKEVLSNEADIILLPTFRPDKAYAIENGENYIQYIRKLGEVTGKSIDDYNDLLHALSDRIDFFHENGCRLSDHGLERIPDPVQDLRVGPEVIFKKVLALQQVSSGERDNFRYCVLLELSRMYHAKSWTQQFHLGALRNTNSRMMRLLGPDTGFDSIGDFRQSESLAKFLNELDSTDQLAKTILYNLNPADNEVIGTMIGNFNDGSVRGKVQFGSGWWFLDQKDGMEKQINALSNLGLLSCFVGMLTDSRSFLSFPRHEYFRRILCNMIGQDVANGELPKDEKLLGKIVSDICYYNAKNYFQFSSSKKVNNNVEVFK